MHRQCPVDSEKVWQSVPGRTCMRAHTCPSSGSCWFLLCCAALLTQVCQHLQLAPSRLDGTCAASAQNPGANQQSGDADGKGLIGCVNQCGHVNRIQYDSMVTARRANVASIHWTIRLLASAVP